MTGEEDYRTFGARAAGALDSYCADTDDPGIALDVLLISLRVAAADCGIKLAGVSV